MRELLQKLLAAEELSFEEAREMILWIMSEDAVSVQAAALLALLQAKGVTVEEMAGAALAMRERASAIAAPKMRLTRAVPAEMESVLLIFLLALQSLQQQLVQLSLNTVTAATHVKAEALKLWKLWE
jgi:hypothetical protein